MITLHDTAFDTLEPLATPILASLARLAFVATLLVYYWASAMTKLGDGLFQPALGAYAQIFPRKMEAVGYDITQLNAGHTLVVMVGTWAEFVLPLLLLLGLATRLAALGMIGFVVVQTWTDVFGHGALGQPETLGAWFDRIPDSPVLDQRLLWLVVLGILVLKGGGPFSVDALLRRQAASG
nr:DoxX family membrane protein [Rhodovulum imhoffii]